MLFRKRLMPVGIPQVNMFRKGGPTPIRTMRPLPIGAGGGGVRKLY